MDVNWNQLGPCRSRLDISFINAVRLSTWALYIVELNRWKASNRRFKHFTLEGKVHKSAKFKGRAKLSIDAFWKFCTWPKGVNRRYAYIWNSWFCKYRLGWPKLGCMKDYHSAMRFKKAMLRKEFVVIICTLVAYLINPLHIRNYCFPQKGLQPPLMQIFQPAHEI